MNASQIHTTHKAVLHLLSTKQVKSAFDKILLLVDDLQMGEYSDRLEEMQQNYRYLLQYFLDGINDPERKSVYDNLISKLFALNAELREELLFRNSTNFEFNQKRYFPYNQHYTSNSSLFDSFDYFHSQTQLLQHSEDNHTIEIHRLRSNFESALNELFGLFWLTTHYTTDEKQLFSKLLSLGNRSWIEKSLSVSGLTLNIWRMFDESKLIMLFDACQSTDTRIRQRALVGLCFVLARYNQFITFFPQIRNRIVLLIDNKHIVENFKNIIIQLIGTAETEEITKKMREEILPEMMKISPLLKDKMDTDSIVNLDEWGEENPEWQEILDQSGVSDKLQELSELQLEGADIYMSTFSMLKNFSFFSSISNWFMPFDSLQSSISDLFDSDDKTVLSAFIDSPLMCNSDKYSFCLSILQMPDKQRSMLKNSMGMGAEQMEEMNKDEAILTPDLVSKNISKQYIQDLFRFFKLFPQHTEFSDMFAFSLIMHRTYLFDLLSSDIEFMKSIAEYYFIKNHYIESLELFEKMQSNLVPTAAIYQKMGYAYQQTSQLAKALDAYLKADIVQPDDVWTIRKIALCFRLQGDFTKALEYYQHAEFLKPNQTSVLFQIGHCYLELGKYKDALAIYYKLDAQHPDDNPKVWRAISWVAFVSGNIQQAEYYNHKLLKVEPTASNYLNAGHIAWCKNNLKNAVELYEECYDLMGQNWQVFLDSFTEDKPYLNSNGIEEDEIPLLLDALRMNIDAL